MISEQKSPILRIHDPLRFGKYAGVCPLDIWTGKPGRIEPKLASEILSAKVSAGDNRMHLKDALSTINSKSSFSYPLSEDFHIGDMRKRIGSQDVNLMLGEKRIAYVHSYRGEPGYILWLIDETEYCFDPQALELLEQTKYFVHESLIIQKFVLSDTHYSFDVLPSNDLKTSVIPQSLLEKNRSKFENRLSTPG